MPIGYGHAYAWVMWSAGIRTAFLASPTAQLGRPRPTSRARRLPPLQQCAVLFWLLTAGVEATFWKKVRGHVCQSVCLGHTLPRQAGLSSPAYALGCAGDQAVCNARQLREGCWISPKNHEACLHPSPLTPNPLPRPPLAPRPLTLPCSLRAGGAWWWRVSAARSPAEVQAAQEMADRNRGVHLQDKLCFCHLSLVLRC